jgi:ribosome-binding factor A
MADPARARRLAVRIRQIVSATIEMQIKDPRLGMVTITDARVTSDLREATVFYTVYGDETQIADSAAALASATGVLRSTVGKQTGIKFVPTLSFVADIVPDTARELEIALERVRHADAELARAREGAQYAGEPDPYRRPVEDVVGDDDLVDDELTHQGDGAGDHARGVLERDDLDRDVVSRDRLAAAPQAQPTRSAP